MPLVHAGDATGSREVGPLASDPLRSAARKVDPRYTEGEPVKVIGARNQTEGEFIQNLLLEEGVPSMLRRARGFDVPDFLASGPRDVLVPQAGLDAAREVLLQSELLDRYPPPPPTAVADWRLLLFLLGGFALVAVIVLIAVAMG